MERHTALITGASSGLGWELCVLAARDGYDVLMVSQDPERLGRAAGRLRSECRCEVDVIPADLSAPNAAHAIHDEISRRGHRVTVLINCAGFAYNGFFADQDPADLNGMLQTNVAALTVLTRLFLPKMLAERSGRVLNVASTAAFQPGPLMSVYYATKAYVVWFTEALAVELEGSGVSATVLCPGPMRTGFEKRAGLRDAPLWRSPLVMDTHRVAEFGYRAMMAGKRVCVPGLLNAATALLATYSPRLLSARLAMRAHTSRSKM